MNQNECIHVAVVIVVLVFVGERVSAYFIKRIKKKEWGDDFRETAEEKIVGLIYRVLGSMDNLNRIFLESLLSVIWNLLSYVLGYCSTLYLDYKRNGECLQESVDG